MIVNREKAIIIPVLLILWLSGYIFEEPISLVLVAVILISLRMVVLYRNVQPVFVFYIFHLTYILILLPYFLFDIPIVPHTDFLIPRYMNLTLLIHGAFVIALYGFSDLNIPNRPIIFSEDLPKKNNAVVVLLLSSIMMAILISMAVGKTNVFLVPADQSWATYLENIDDTVVGAGASEYFPVFFLTAFIFARRTYLRWILSGIFCSFAYLAFTRGMRVSLLMPSLLYFALFLDGKIKIRYLLLLTIAGMVFIQAAGALRDGRYGMAEVFSISSGGQILTNQSEVFYTSNIIVSSVIDGICGLKERAFSLFAASVQAIFPSYVGWRVEGQPSMYVWKLTQRMAGGGSLVSAVFYFWMDYPGVVMIAYFLARVSNRAIKKPTPLLAMYIICVYSFYPRWLAYNAINFLFRVPLYAIILYLVLIEFHAMAFRRKPNRNIILNSETLP